MSDEKEPTQRTEKGHEIPVPKRSAWDKLLRKVANPKSPNGKGVVEHTDPPAPREAHVPLPGVEQVRRRIRKRDKGKGKPKPSSE